VLPEKQGVLLDLVGGCPFSTPGSEIVQDSVPRLSGDGFDLVGGGAAVGAPLCGGIILVYLIVFVVLTGFLKLGNRQRACSFSWPSTEPAISLPLMVLPLWKSRRSRNVCGGR